jgi:hypothetical protein
MRIVGRVMGVLGGLALMYFGFHQMIGKLPFPFTTQEAARGVAGLCTIMMLLGLLLISRSRKKFPDTPATPPLPSAGIRATSPPDADTAVQQQREPATTGAIPLPPPAPQPQPLTSTELGLLHVQLDAVLVAGALLLSFLLASVAVRNTDFWQHLATGRALVDGHYNPLTGQDPFSYTTQSQYWVNHSWLFDLLLYGVTWLVGGSNPDVSAVAAGPVLVLLKALLVTATAAVLLLIRRPGRSLWLPAAATLLAVLAASPRLLNLQPHVVSFLFLAVTLWLLQRPSSKTVPLSWLPRGWPGSGPSAPSHLWWLPPLFFLWVNLDTWFLLGPLTVALFLLGDFLEGATAAQKAAPAGTGQRRTLAAVLGVGLLACLLNPFHVNAFLALPAEIAFSGPVTLVQQDQRYEIFFLSPFTERYAEVYGLSVAGLSFFALLLLGVGSFVATPSALKSWRGPVFAVFGLLACWRWELIALFAVVAGPILVLNFQDWMARRRPVAAPAPEGPTDRLALEQLGSFLTGRWLAGLSGAALGLLAVLLVGLIALIVWLRSDEATAAYVLTLAGVPKPPVAALVFLSLLLGLGLAFLVLLLRYRYQAFTSWPVGGRLLTFLGMLVLLVLVWPGWVQVGTGDLTQARRVTWSVEPEESLMRAAQKLREWRKDNLLTGNGFNWVPQVGNYCAWFCYLPGQGPAEKDYFDLRFQLFPNFDTYNQVRKALNQENPEPLEAPTPQKVEALQSKFRQRLKDEVEAEFQDRDISHVIVYEPVRTSKSGVVVAHLLGNTFLNPGAPHWTLLYQDGRTTIFGWDPRTEAGAERFAAVKSDVKQAAFGPQQEQAGREGEAPAEPAKQPPLARSWLGEYLVGQPPHPLEADEASAHLAAFDGSKGRYLESNLKVWRAGYATATIGGATWSAPGGGGPAATAVSAALTAFRGRLAELVLPNDQGQMPAPGKPMNLQQRVEGALRNFLAGSQLQSFQGLDQGEPARAVLAVRAARRAIRRNPEDAAAYLTLYQAYLNQGQATRERAWRALLPPLGYLRQVQMINALQTAINLQEDSRAAGVAHAFLAQLYLEPSLSYVDLALQHRKEQLRLARLHGALPGETADDTDNRIKQLEDAVERLEEEVGKRNLQFGVGSAQGELVLKRAKRALAQGLAEEALQTLLQSNIVEFRDEGAQLQINLLLTMGRAESVRRLMNDNDVVKNAAALGNIQLGDAVLPAYAWFQLVLAEVAGDEVEAGKQWEQLCQTVAPPRPGERTSLWFLLGNGVLDALPRPGPSKVMNAYGHFLRLVSNPTRLQILQYVLAVRGPQPAPNQSLVLDLEVMQFALLHRQYADLLVVRGILALDDGDTDRARKWFAEALRYAATEDGPRFEFDSFARPARHYLGLLEEQK